VTTKLASRIALSGLLPVLSIVSVLAVEPQPVASRTQVVLLGTENPPADHDRSGPATAVVVKAHGIKPGVVYKDTNVTVTAFSTKHTLESYGYRCDTIDRSIVISGDTNPTQATIDACNRCDILIHVY
jgi:ribonuclease BN (tRNA processing enzyme)